MFGFKESKEKQLSKAFKSFEQGRIKEGMDSLFKLALDGYPEAEYWLGDIYEFKIEDYDEAAKWYSFAATHGHAKAQWCLGNMLMAGKGIESNMVTASHWYRKAAENNIPEAQFMMGELLRVGRDIPKNTVEALNWYERSYRNGFTQAKQRIDQMKMI